MEQKTIQFITGICHKSGDLIVIYTKSKSVDSAKDYYKSALLPCYLDSAAELIETYKEHEILLWNDIYVVFDTKNKTRFVIGLDDSKRCGNKVFVESANTVKNAKKHIDYKTKI